MIEQKVQNLRFIIDRCDKYIAGANIKGNFLLAFNVFLTGSAIANYSELTQLVDSANGLWVLKILMWMLFAVSLIAIVKVINAVYPYLHSGNSSVESYHSHVYFNSISEFESNSAYFKSFDSLSETDIYQDLTNQAYQLSKGLESKHKHLKWAMSFVYVELAIIFLALMTITIGL